MKRNGRITTIRRCIDETERTLLRLHNLVSNNGKATSIIYTNNRPQREEVAVEEVVNEYEVRNNLIYATKEYKMGKKGQKEFNDFWTGFVRNCCKTDQNEEHKTARMIMTIPVIIKVAKEKSAVVEMDIDALD